MKPIQLRARVFVQSRWTRSMFCSLIAIQAWSCGGQSTEEEVASQRQALVDTSICPEGKNIIVGTEGDDHLVGTDGNDCILGLGGNDTLEGGNGIDWLIGGEGDDSLSGDNAGDRLEGGPGNDTLTGGNGNDILEGGSGADLIGGENGDDTIDGGEGNDYLSGDNGSDSLLGSQGSDTLMGGNGDDELDGGEGDDVLVGENGSDAVEGQAGNDILVGGNGTDWLFGGAGNDLILGGRSSDHVEGGEGIDTCDQACCEAILPDPPTCYTNADCTSGQYCVPEAGVCVSCQADATCADNVFCTQDVCQPAFGCSNPPLPNGTACDDGDACQQTDSCIEGTCVGSNPVVCTALDQCHVVGSCDPANGTCSNPPIADGTSCSDGDACSVSDSCTAGICAGAPMDCDDDNPCSDDACVVGACRHIGNGSCVVPKSFVEVGGRLVLEAEDFNLNTPRSDHSWELTADPLASAGNAMLAVPNSGTLINETALNTCPQLDFNVNFTTAGTYYVWIRAAATTTNDDTCHVGVDGVASDSTRRMYVSGSAYSWSNKSTSAYVAANINVSTTGMHTVNIWMREDGFRIDRVLFTTDSKLTPAGVGPVSGPVAGCDGLGEKFLGNPELCDGRDNDCDGIANFPGENADVDRDGFLACAECDDQDARRFPGNPEVCDGRDNDCDGIASYPNETIDTDQDGSPTCADCNDADPRNFPGNPEQCDGRDNDCNGRADADPAGEVDADNDSILSCRDCNDQDSNNTTKLSFLVHGPTSDATTATPQIRLLADAPVDNLWLSATAPLTWTGQVVVPQRSSLSYRYVRTDSADSTEVGPWGEPLPARSAKVECSALVVEDAIWNWDDLTANGTPAPLDKGPAVSAVGDSSSQITVTVTLSSPQNVTLHYSTVSNSYPPENVLVGAANNRYEFALNGLQPGTTYFYYVEYGGQVTSEYRFTTSSPLTQRYRFAAFGDSQDQSGTAVHREIVARTYAFHPDVVIRTGDLVNYGTDQNLWNSFFAIERPLLSSALYLPEQGNHESLNSSNSNFVNFFALPTNGSSEKYFSVRYNNTLFLGLFTENTPNAVPAVISTNQTNWLKSTLDAANADPTILWKVAYFHRPPYSSGEHGSDSAVRSTWQPIFKEKGVQLVFSGHDHDYERSVVEGTQYLVIGGAGSDLRPVGSDLSRTVFSESVFHYVLVDVDDRTLTTNVYRLDGRRMDGFTITLPKP